MNAQEIKTYIYENHGVEEVLEKIGCHSIRSHGDYWTCGNKSGDNKSAITVYNNEHLSTINYTRQISSNPSLPTDLINLVEYNEELSFFQALKFLCDLFNLNVYQSPVDDLPESLRISKMLLSMNGSNDDDDETPITPIPENVLSYYQTPCVNNMFLQDGISYQSQIDFLLGYDSETNRLTIPIFDEHQNLVSVKGRLFKETLNEDDLKYIYLFKCPRNKILFGYNKTQNYIKEQGKAIITESEKGCMQLWSYGYKNGIGIGGKKISKVQVEKLTRLAVDLVFAFDRDVERSEIESIANMFVDGVNIYSIYDNESILSEKESPSDNQEKFEYLLKNNVYRIK
jgi:DNA primase